MTTVWKSICTGERAEKANLIAKTIGNRVLNLTPNNSVFNVQGNLHHYQLVDYSALAILYRTLHQTVGNSDYKLLAEKHLSYAIFDSVPMRNFALLNGLSQLGIAALLSSEGSIRHENLLINIDAHVHSESIIRCRQIKAFPEGHQLNMSEYDVVSGISGVIGYLLMRRSKPLIQETLSELLLTLISLVLPKSEDTLTTHSVTKFLVDHFADNDGFINCGLAHGIPGVLTALSIARSANVEVDGLSESIQLLAKWLENIAVLNHGCIGWPYKVAEGSQNSMGSREISHNGWCYGAPGILRSIWLAGRALGDETHENFASEGMSKLLSSARIADSQNGNSICHGLAGRLLISIRFYNDTQLENIRLGAIVLLDGLLAAFHDEYPFGYREPDLDDALVDDPGLVSGAAGAALVLLAASSNIEPMWDRLLMVS